MAKNKITAKKQPLQPSTPSQPANVVDFGPEFDETYSRYQHLIGTRWPQWLAAKMENPIRAIGKDEPFAPKGPLAGYMHAKLDDDINVVYRLVGANPRRLKVYGFYSHEDLGTMGKPRKQQAAADRLARQVFENRPKYI